MRKLLSLMSLLAVSSTTVTSVVACSNEKDNLSFDFSNSKDTLQDGTINVLGKVIDDKTKVSPEQIVNDIKQAIVIRLQTGILQNVFTNLKPSDFKLTFGLDTPITPTNNAIVENDQVKDATGLFNLVKNSQTNKYEFVLTPNKGKAVFFTNNMCIRDYIAMQPQALLNYYTTKPIHIFVAPSTIKTVEDFKQIFWNGILGQPASYSKQKDNFEVTISKDDLNTITTLPVDNTTTKSVSVTFKILKDFKTIQSGFAFSAKDAAGTANVQFQTKISLKN